jgi:hypothetical protein
MNVDDQFNEENKFKLQMQSMILSSHLMLEDNIIVSI